MPTSPIIYIVCESTGRWAAAMRVALARKRFSPDSFAVSPRIQEVRSLSQLEPAISTQDQALGFVEVRADNLGPVLDLLAKCQRRNVRLVALLEGELDRKTSSTDSLPPTGTLSSDAVEEAGALAAIESPRQIALAIAFAERYFASHTRSAAPFSEQQSIADRAWAALPWQDA
jgi:hypothetical protein